MSTTIALVSDKTDLANGTHRGVWSGYSITVRGARVLETEDGCRSIDGCPVIIRVSHGRATAEEQS